ncbi:hypothetical protein D9M68_459330 [compost metagenome]
MTEVYALQQPDFEPDALAIELHRYFRQQEDSEIARIQAMLQLFSSDSCLSARLARYFGDHEVPERCGHCSVCRGRVAHLPDPPALAPLAERNFSALCGGFSQRYQELRGEPPSADCLTRLLCGISAPLFTRLKARSLPGFAALEAYPYAEVREWVSQQPGL